MGGKRNVETETAANKLTFTTATRTATRAQISVRYQR